MVKQKLKLSWIPYLNIDDSLDLTIKWYLNDKTNTNMFDFTQNQIEQYFRIGKNDSRSKNIFTESNS